MTKTRNANEIPLQDIDPIADFFTVQNFEYSKSSVLADKYTHITDSDNENNHAKQDTHVCAQNYSSLYKNGFLIKGPQQKSADKMIIGYSDQGLPFQIIVESTATSRIETFAFIDDRVCQLISDYTSELCESENPEETIRQLIRDIYALRHTQGQYTEFSMAVALTYENDEGVYCAGFSIGHPGIVLYRSKYETQQLAHSTIKKVSASKTITDSFSDYSSQITGIENVINRNSIFCVPVNPNDYIYGYTNVLDELKLEEDAVYYEHTDPSTDAITTESVNRYAFDDIRLKYDNLLPEDNFIKQANASVFQQLTLRAQRDNKTCAFGNYCTTGYFRIPTPEMQAVQARNLEIIQQQKRELVKKKAEFMLLLSLLKNDKKNADVFSAGQCVYKQICTLEKNPETDINELIEDLIACNNALIDGSKKNIEALLARAERVKNKPTIGAQAKGAFLMLLGLGIAAIGGLVLAGSALGLTTFIFTLPAAAAIPVAAGFFATGAATGMAGLGLFLHGHVQNRSKDISDLADAIEHKDDSRFRKFLRA